MRPRRNSETLLAATRSKAKMFEYGVDSEHHIALYKDPARLFSLTIGLLGQYTAGLNRGQLEEEQERESKKDLLFAAYFFDAYLQSQLDSDLEPYLLLLGSASYYLCDLPGSSSVLAKKLNTTPNLDAYGLEALLLWILKGEFDVQQDLLGRHTEIMNSICQAFILFWESGNEIENILSLCQVLRNNIYTDGTSRELLIADVIVAIARKRIINSSWTSLPAYTGMSIDHWRDTIQKDTFIKELWPAQHMLGDMGMFSGSSGVVQMPTSAGKTKAIEIIIRAAFIADRTSLVVIVAPYRALCHEIKNSLNDAFINEDVHVNEMTDIPFFDFDLEVLLTGKQVLIVTPEKLLYMLRHNPELSDDIGLIIYDEGHQFDNGSRGITFELLLTSLKNMIQVDTQVVLISAVISNADVIGNWLIGEGSVNVVGTHLTPTFRTLAFASWIHTLGRLEFVSTNNPDEGEFFVPRIIEPLRLQLFKRERKERSFPSIDDSQSIALYLGLKLAHNGAVAVFVGRKSTATSVGEKLIDIFKRAVPLREPRTLSDQTEVDSLTRLMELNLGQHALETQCSNIGVFIHHGNIPQGIRLAVEFAIKEAKIKFVICTSTLAQGVNLPLRYLIITSLYQGSQKIKIRDFHNLMGRAGRSGMHTEGSIIFADPEIYDKRRVSTERWRWAQAKEALNPSNSEPCLSTLLTLFDPIESDDRRYDYDLDIIEIVKIYYSSAEVYSRLIASIASEEGFSLNNVERQLSEKISIISSAESFIMTHWNFQEYKEEAIDSLAEQTLAYYLGSNSQKANLIELFRIISRSIHGRVESNEIKQKFGKTLMGLEKTLRMLEWLRRNIDELLLCTTIEELLIAIWPLLHENIDNNTFNKCDPPEPLVDICNAWIVGSTYAVLFETISNTGVVLRGKKARTLKLEDLVEICDNSLSYEGALILGAVLELLPLLQIEDITNLTELIEGFQKRLKYGLPSRKAITLYEMGFSDRVIAQELANLLGVARFNKRVTLIQLRTNEEAARTLLANFPTYFQMIYQQNLVR